MMLLNGHQAVAHASRICGVRCVIGCGDVSKAVRLMVEESKPEILDLHGDSATSASTSRTLAGQRCLIENVSDAKSLALARIPVVCTAPEPKNWSITIVPSGAQEAFDDAIIAYALAERALLPATVVLDKLSGETFEAIEIVSEKSVKNFIGELKLDKNHGKFARQDLEGRAQAQKAMELAKALLPKISQEWKKRSRRTIELFEPFMVEDAELAIVAFGSSSTNAKLAVQELRKQGEKVGMLRLHVLRPWPEQELQSMLQNVSRIAVVDNQVSLGSWSKLYQGIKTWYSGFASNFIAGDLVTVKDFVDIVRRLRASSAPERVWMV